MIILYTRSTVVESISPTSIGVARKTPRWWMPTSWAQMISWPLFRRWMAPNMANTSPFVTHPPDAMTGPSITAVAFFFTSTSSCQTVVQLVVGHHRAVTVCHRSTGNTEASTGFAGAECRPLPTRLRGKACDLAARSDGSRDALAPGRRSDGPKRVALCRCSRCFDCGLDERSPACPSWNTTVCACFFW